ncbi:MAG: nucleotidyltransferase domain-containing protein [Spirochaetales bacterium]|nr:nucleotidyltransferase domain-containing protein [Spirochaetales bacterium]
MSFGLKEQDLEIILAAIKNYTEIEKAQIFGSRAKGNFSTGSDIDLAIYGKTINIDIVASLSYKLNELLSLPYYFDIVHYESISTPDLIEHIDRVGKSLYKLD